MIGGNASVDFFVKVAPRDGFEPSAIRLTVGCSTAELPGSSHQARGL